MKVFLWRFLKKILCVQGWSFVIWNDYSSETNLWGSHQVSCHLFHLIQPISFTKHLPFRSQIDILVKVLQADGGNLCVCTNAATLALIDAVIMPWSQLWGRYAHNKHKTMSEWLKESISPLTPIKRKRPFGNVVKPKFLSSRKIPLAGVACISSTGKYERRFWILLSHFHVNIWSRIYYLYVHYFLKTA